MLVKGGPEIIQTLYVFFFLYREPSNIMIIDFPKFYFLVALSTYFYSGVS